MIEILILFVLSKREKTIYSIRKEITELFGVFTKPSIGTIHPALKRLLQEKAVVVNERFSDGGKKSSYYSITKKGFESFRTYFFTLTRDNPSLFHTQVLARLGTMGLLNIEERKHFIIEFSKRIDIYIFEIENSLNDEFLGLDYFQEELLKRILSELTSLKEYMKKLKVE